jgi:hypothetical protein
LTANRQSYNAVVGSSFRIDVMFLDLLRIVLVVKARVALLLINLIVALELTDEEVYFTSCCYEGCGSLSRSGG